MKIIITITLNEDVTRHGADQIADELLRHIHDEYPPQDMNSVHFQIDEEKNA